MPTFRSAAKRALDHLAEHDESLVGEFDRGDGERLEGIRGGVGRGGG